MRYNFFGGNKGNLGEIDIYIVLIRASHQNWHNVQKLKKQNMLGVNVEIYGLKIFFKVKTEEGVCSQTTNSSSFHLKGFFESVLRNSP